MKKKDTLLIIVPRFPQDSADTVTLPAIQVYIENLMEKYEMLDFIVMTVQFPFWMEKYYWNDIRVFSTGGKNKGGLFRFLNFLRAIYFLLEIKFRSHVIGIHAFQLEEPVLFGQFFSRILNVPIIATIMDRDVLPGNKLLKKMRFSKMTIVSPSDKASKTFYNSTKRNADAVIPFGANKFPECNPKIVRTFDIIGAGRLIQDKNYNIFIDVIDKLKNEFPNIRCAIIGDGELYQPLEKEIIERNLSENIRLMGNLQRDVVFDFMNRTKIFLHTSTYEAQGRVFLEALKFGCELVCFDVGFLPESQKIHICSDENEMIETIKGLLKNNSGTCGENYYSVETTVDKFINVYKKAGIRIPKTQEELNSFLD